MKTLTIPLVFLWMASSPAAAQTLPECPSESQNIKDVSLAHAQKIEGEYEQTMKSRRLVVDSMISDLKAAGRWDRAIHKAWDEEIRNAPEFVRSVKAMEAAEAAEEPALIAFISLMDGPRKTACHAMNKYFQTKLDFFAENYKQLAIVERALRTRLEAIPASGKAL